MGLQEQLDTELIRQQLIDQGNNNSLVRSVARKFRDDFNGTALDLSEWNVIQLGAGHSITVSNSELNIATGTNINAVTVIRSAETFTLAAGLKVTYKLSQRIANQEFIIEFVDSTGQHYAQIVSDGTSGTTSKFATANGGVTTGFTALTTATTASYQILEIEAFTDEVNFYTRAVDSSNQRAGLGNRTRQIPDPNLRYYVQIRARNLNTAPASSTTFTIDSVMVMDIQELTTEITGGRGGGNLSSAVPIVALAPITIAGTIPVSITTQSVYDNFITYSEFTTAFTASQSLTNSSRDSILQRSMVRGLLMTDQLGVINVEQSIDATTWRQTHTFTPGAAPATQAYLFDFKLYLRYYRIKYTNGATASTTMILTTSMFAIGSGNIS